MTLQKYGFFHYGQEKTRFFFDYCRIRCSYILFHCFFYGDDFATQTEFPEGSSDNFHSLFYRNLFLVSAENLVLPAPVLVDSCYQYMFYYSPSIEAVYSNPVADKLHITGADIQSVRLFDPQGRLVHSEECDRDDRVELDFQGYARGVYTISILSKGKNVSRKVMY